MTHQSSKIPPQRLYSLIENLTTEEKDVTKVLQPDGDNGVEWGVDGSLSGKWVGATVFSKTGSLNTTTVLKVRNTDTFNSGKYYGTTNAFELIGIRYNITSSAASGAGSLIVDIRYETKDGTGEHVVGGGTSLKTQTIITAGGVEGTIDRRGDEISFTGVSLVQDRIYYVDVSSIGSYVVTDLEIELIIK